jgi:5-methyltetrahydrofolate--homocysteine methyltransferase
MSESILELLKKRRIYFDGAEGTMLQKMGLEPGKAPEMWNIDHPEKITELHRMYLDVGSDVITANTFGINRLKYDNCEKLSEEAMNCAKSALEGYTGRYIAFDIGPTGKLLEPFGDLSFEDAVSVFSEQCSYAEKFGADLIVIETMNDSYETKAALLAAKETTHLPVFVTNVYDAQGKMMTGADPVAMVALLESLGADAIGLNCSLGPDLMLPVIKKIAEYSSLPIMVQPNAGMPEIIDGRTAYAMNSDEFADKTRLLAEAGATILGGCCGTEPMYIKKLKQNTEKLEFRYPSPKDITFVSSYTHAVIIGESPVLIGERINPTGKKKFKEALRNGDIAYINGEGIKENDAGADILDVNVGLPEIDELKMMQKVIVSLQSVTDLPIQIDTSDPRALEGALRLCNGKPMINSVNGTEESMKNILPLAKKYGGVLVALTLDENGIPETAEGRIKVALNIIDHAEKMGIERKNIIIDTLTMTVATSSDSARVTLESVKKLHEMGIHTILGVSNISFGLPERDKINSTFFASALASGLNCAIMNPFSAAMMDAYRAYMALFGYDEACKRYIEYASGKVESTTLPSKSESEKTLSFCIYRGMSEQACSKARKLLETEEPLEVVNTEIIPGLDQIGHDFEIGKAFLPQLLMSAEAANAAFAIVKEKIPASDSESGKSVILATVKGDIHDIGKNIVRVVMESYGYTVYDLGKDVEPEKVLEKVRKTGCRLVGLSALMTTTVPSMEETIRLLKNEKSDVKVMVGGAVMNSEYADMIGADYYGRDAMDTVKIADKYYSTIIK